MDKISKENKRVILKRYSLLVIDISAISTLLPWPWRPVGAQLRAQQESVDPSLTPKKKKKAPEGRD
jgi:hypothetical protein